MPEQFNEQKQEADEDKDPQNVERDGFGSRILSKQKPASTSGLSVALRERLKPGI